MDLSPTMGTRVSQPIRDFYEETLGTLLNCDPLRIHPFQDTAFVPPTRITLAPICSWRNHGRAVIWGGRDLLDVLLVRGERKIWKWLCAASIEAEVLTYPSNGVYIIRSPMVRISSSLYTCMRQINRSMPSCHRGWIVTSTSEDIYQFHIKHQ
jgi:hypothetical protein